MNRSVIFLASGGCMLFVTFIVMGIISIQVMAIIEKYEINEDFPNSQKFIHQQLPNLSNLQLVGSIFLHAGIALMIVGGIFYYKERKKNQASKTSE